MSTFYQDSNGLDLYDVLIPKIWYGEGTLWMWGGNNIYGNLGTNDITSRSSPVQTVTGGTNWKQVDCGDFYNIGCIKTDGTLWMWGNNGHGQLGTQDIIHRSSPIQTIAGGTNWKQVSCGSLYASAIKTDGTLWLWGWNFYGQLGTQDRTHRSSPVQTVAGGTNWKQVACSGGGHTGAIKTDGTLWTWGDNTYGQLGTQDIIHRSSPIQTIAGGTNWKQVAGGSNHTCAIKTDGTLWMWGENTYGQLGTQDIIHRSSPIQTIAGGTNWKQVDCVGHTGAIKTDGTLWMWGANFYGQLGTQDRTHRSSPVQTVAGGTNWKQVAGGSNFTGAIKADGTLWLWGFNDSGRLGSGDEIHRSSPVQTVAGGTNWKQVSGGVSYTGAVKDDGI